MQYALGDKIKSQYEVRRICSGGMGIVYLCYDHSNSRIIALKTIKPEFILSELRQNSFTNEALTWIELGEHSNIVHATSVETISGQPYIFLECILGVSGEDPVLRRWLSQGPLPRDMALMFALQFCDGMIYATNQLPGLVHGDVKPENILIDSHRALKITDFGIARGYQSPVLSNLHKDDEIESGVLEQEKRTMPYLLGTPAYLAPELIEREEISTANDIYAFGIILYEMLTGRYPYVYQTISELRQGHLQVRPREPREFREELTRDLSALVMRCLEKTPEARYRDFSELKDALSDVAPKLAQHLRPSSASFDSSFSSLINRTHSLYNLGFHDAALQVAEQAVESYSDVADVWSNMGAILAAVDRRDDALKHYDRAIQLRPDYLRAHINRAATLTRLGRHGESFESMEKIVGEFPIEPEAWVNRGVALSALKQWSQAEKSYRRAVELDPFLPEAWNNLGAVVYPIAYIVDSKRSNGRTIIPTGEEPFNWERLAQVVSQGWWKIGELA